jgi:YidC/Oxa1 family membrane protein insertase
MQDIQPELKKLQKQHKDNKEQLNKEIAELYKTKGINPLGCVLPLIIQMPVWFALFRVLREPLNLYPKMPRSSPNWETPQAFYFIQWTFKFQLLKLQPGSKEFRI